jgi:hypothetical protein
MKKTSWFVAWVLVLVVGTSLAEAQTSVWQDSGYLAVSVGGQVRSRSFTEVSAPEIYDEPASVTVPHEVGAAVLVDVAGGMRVWRNLGIGVGYSRFSDKYTPTLSAKVPNPVVFDNPRDASSSAGEFSHTESVVHLQFLWMMPLSEYIHVAAVVGPSFFSVGQDVVADLTLTEGSQPFSTVTIASVATTDEKKWAVGFTAGLDATYLITIRMGAGVFVRYSAASADLPVAGGGTTSVAAGGFQVGGGLRVRF